MKRVFLYILGGVLIFLSCGLSLAEEKEVKVDLSYYEGPKVQKLFWAKKDIDREAVLPNPLKIYGTEVSYSQRQLIYTLTIIFKYKDQSHKKVSKQQKPIGLIIPGKLGDQEKELPLIIRKPHSHNKTDEFAGILTPGWMMVGKLGKINICLIDANCDGQFDTEGNDCIAVNSKYAMRLSKKTSINGVFFEVEVKPDGSELTFKEYKPRNLAKVTLNEGFKGWPILTLTNKDATYNIATDKCNIIPADKYKIGYGINVRRKNVFISLRLGKDFDPELDIRGNRINIINIGAPFSLYFEATFKLNRMTIKPVLAVMGCHGELYVYHTIPHKPVPWQIRGYICDGRPDTKTKPRTFGSMRMFSDEYGNFKHYNKIVSIPTKGVSIVSGYVYLYTKKKLRGFGKLQNKVVFGEGETPKPEKPILIQYEFPKR